MIYTYLYIIHILEQNLFICLLVRDLHAVEVAHFILIERFIKFATRIINSP